MIPATIEDVGTRGYRTCPVRIHIEVPPYGGWLCHIRWHALNLSDEVSAAGPSPVAAYYNCLEKIPEEVVKMVEATCELTPQKRKEESLRSDLMRIMPHIEAALPRHINAERMNRIALNAANKTPGLLDCNRRSFLLAVILAAELGLEPDGLLGEAHLIPFENKRRGVHEAQLIIGYRGLMKLARQSGEIESIQAHAVYEADKFEYSEGLSPKLEHTPSRNANRGGLVAVYAIAYFRSGFRQAQLLWKAEVDTVRSRAPGRNSDAWCNHYEAMALKTAIRRLCKYLPASVELKRALSLEEAAEREEPQEHLMPQFPREFLADENEPAGTQTVDLPAEAATDVANEPHGDEAEQMVYHYRCLLDKAGSIPDCDAVWEACKDNAAAGDWVKSHVAGMVNAQKASLGEKAKGKQRKLTD
jgi:recombination protein RecT